jgi:hypothetical protein
MSGITVLTTFHQPGLDKYGQRFINSFAEKVDKKIKLWVYAENCVPINPDPDQIVVIDAVSALPELQLFKAKWKNEPKANGSCPWPERRPRDHHKQFKWDAVRFANKVYAVFDACERNTDWVVWMDADTFVHSNWSYEQFNNLLPQPDWLTYVGRGKGSQTWPECGFYGINLNHKTSKEFLQEFKSYYDQAESKMFTQEEWHDSYIFGLVLNKFKKTYPNVLDYTEDVKLSIAKTGGGGHPLINTTLGKWIDHLKGDRKNLGKSSLKDLQINHKTSYWINNR